MQRELTPGYMRMNIMEPCWAVRQRDLLNAKSISEEDSSKLADNKATEEHYNKYEGLKCEIPVCAGGYVSN